MACIEANKKNIDNLRRLQQKLTEVPVNPAALGTVQSESVDLADRQDTAAAEGMFELLRVFCIVYGQSELGMSEREYGPNVCTYTFFFFVVQN